MDSDSATDGGTETEGDDEPSVKQLVEEVRDTVTRTKEAVDDHGERLDALESEVFKDDEETAEPSAAGDDVDVEEEAEKAVKDLLGLDDEELPDDPDDRRQVLRKALHEEESEHRGIGSPESWSEDETQEVIK